MKSSCLPWAAAQVFVAPQIVILSLLTMSSRNQVGISNCSEWFWQSVCRFWTFFQISFTDSRQSNMKCVCGCPSACSCSWWLHYVKCPLTLKCKRCDILPLSDPVYSLSFAALLVVYRLSLQIHLTTPSLLPLYCIWICRCSLMIRVMLLKVSIYKRKWIVFVM